MAEVSMKDVRDYFGMSGQDMIKEWKALTDEDKVQIKQGIGDGTLTY